MSRKFITVMFPYPSGAGLHLGHWYNYTIVNSYCNLLRYMGEEVYQPFGYDVFGLPTENYAIKINKPVEEVAKLNIQNFTEEMKRMNVNFEYKLSTWDKDYVAKTQWLFKELLNRGLAYKDTREEPYCPSCKTSLAREQVKNGCCERCNTPVEYKSFPQWFFKITDYKDRLIKDLDKVDYPESTKKQQRAWLENLHDWCVSRQRKFGCPIPIEGEEDTLDTFVDSSFYCIEYDKSRPVDIYVGGKEHACMHLIYARFICKFLYDIGYIDFDEPFKKVVHQGMILGPDGNKMSKSLGNIIDPRNYDNVSALKMTLMSINHYFDGGIFNDSQYKSNVKFVNNLIKWFSVNDCNNIPLENEEDFIKRTSQYMLDWKVNKVVSEWRIFYNKYKSFKPSNKIKEFYKVLFN